MSERKIALNWGRLASELAVIVTGILLALTVDSWVDSRRDRGAEREYLQRLLADLTANTTELHRVDRILEAVRSHGMALVPLLSGRHSVTDTVGLFASLLHSTNSPEWPVARTGAHSDLVTTGNVALLRNDELRRAVADYYARAERLQDAWDRDISYYRNTVRRLIHPDTRLQLAEACPRDRMEPLHCSENLVIPDAPEVLDFLSDNLEMKGNLYLFLQQVGSWMAYVQEALVLTEQLHQQVAAEIN